MRRGVDGRRVAGLALAAALAVTAGCGSDDGSDAGSGAGDGDERAATTVDVTVPEGTGFPVTFEHALGSTTVEEEPERIVTLGEADAVHAVGLTPVGVNTTVEESPWLEDELIGGTTEMLDTTDGLSVEAVASLQPDLIIAVRYFEVPDVYEELSAVAPTIAYASEWGSETWQEVTALVGRATGRVDEAQAAVAETEDEIAAVRDALPGLEGQTFTMSSVFAADEIVTLASETDPSVRFMTDLGLELSPEVADLPPPEQGNPGGSLSFEQVELLDADGVFITYMSEELGEAFEDNPLVDQLDAVADDRYFVVDLTTIVQLRSPSVLGIRWALDEITPALEAMAA